MAARIVLAEDNGQLAQALSRFLMSQGHEVTVAGTGLQALQALTAGKTDLLVLDLRLPELSGIDLLQKLRRTPQGEKLPVLIMTGVFKGERYAEAARRLGVRHYLEKPFTQKIFQDAVTELLSGEPLPAPRAFLEILAELYTGRRTGILAWGSAPPVAFLSGEPVSFQSTGGSAFLSFLATRSLLLPAEVKQYDLAGKERLQLSRAGIITYDDLVEESRSFLRRTLTEGLITDHPASFSDGSGGWELPFTPLPLPQFLYEAILGGACSAGSEGFLARNGGLYPARSPSFYAISNLTSYRQDDIDLLTQMDGHRSLAELCAANPVRSAAFFRYLEAFSMVAFTAAPADAAAPLFPLKCDFNRPLEDSALADDKLIGFDDVVEELAAVEPLVGEESMGSPLSREEIGAEQALQRELAAIQGKNYYELFGLTGQTFSFVALKTAYFARTREYSPEKFLELSGSALELAQDILAAYAGAYNTLSNVVAKERYDEMLNANTVGLDGRRDDHLQASIQFQSGQVFLEMGEFDNAEKALQDAYTLEPDNPLHSAYLAWVIYRNPANATSRSAQERARTLLGRSLQNDKNADAFAFRGWMLLDEGRDGLAEGDFQKAQRINPRNALARKGLARIAEKREAEKKGIFRKIFG
jgi:CheY-like chemotaxis protein/tetratricopeptide (TPR) repeat protein